MSRHRLRPFVVLRALADAALVAGTAYAVSRVVEIASTDDINFLLWLFAGAVLHDAVLLPAYVIADLLMRVVVQDHALRRTRVVNFVRIPIGLSLLLLLVFLPSVLGRNDANLARVGGQPEANDPLTAWLSITAAMLVVSALALAIRVRRQRRSTADAA